MWRLVFTRLQHATHTSSFSKAVCSSGIGLGVAAFTLRPAQNTSCFTVDNKDAVSGVISNFLNSEEGKQLVANLAKGAVKEASDAAWWDIKKWSETEVNKRITSDVPKAVAEAKAKVEKAAKQASDDSWWKIQKWAQEEVKKVIEKEIKTVIANDPQLQRIIGENIIVMRSEVRQEAERVLREVAEEERYQKVNNAVLDVLRRRSEDLLDKNQREAAKTVKGVQAAVDARVSQDTASILWNARLGQLLAVVAVISSCVMAQQSGHKPR